MVCTGIDGGQPDRSADRCAPPVAYIRGISVFKEIYLPDQRSSDGPYVDRTGYFTLSSVRGDFWDSLLHCDGCCGDLSDLHNCDRLQLRIYLSCILHLQNDGSGASCKRDGNAPEVL